MIGQYLDQYEAAVASGDTVAKRKIERDLGRLGMDKATLTVLMKDRNKKLYYVWISDSESGCCQPMKVKAKSEEEARRAGLRYIRAWNLQDAEIAMIVEV